MRDAVVGELAVGQRRDPRRPVLAGLDRRAMRRPSCSSVKPMSGRAMASRFTTSRQAAYSLRARAQELAPRRDLARTGPRPGPACRAAARPAPRPPARHCRRCATSRRRRAPGSRCVSRATLAIDGSASPRKPKRRDLVDRVVGQLRGGVALERQRHLGRRHAAAVVGHLDPVDAARRRAGPRSASRRRRSRFRPVPSSALAGRSTTSPAAMRLTRSLGQAALLTC